MGLNVGVIGAEERFGPVSCQVLGDVNNLTASVIPPAGVPFRVLVGHDRTHGFEHSFRNNVLGCDEFDDAHLPLFLILNGRVDLRVSMS